MQSIGFIGLGNMGASIALNIREAGHPLTVSDLHKASAERHLEAGADWAETPAALATRCEVIFLSQPGPKEIRHVAVDGAGSLSEDNRPGTVVVDLSTNSPTTVREMHAHFGALGCHSLTGRSAAARAVRPARNWRSGWAATGRCSTPTAR